MVVAVMRLCIGRSKNLDLNAGRKKYISLSPEDYSPALNLT